MPVSKYLHVAGQAYSNGELGLFYAIFLHQSIIKTQHIITS